MSGQVFGFLPGNRWSPVTGPIHPILNWNVYAADVGRTRRLYHSGLSLAVDYPTLPQRTLNFSWDVLTRRDLAIQKTLTSTQVSLWEEQVDDVIIKEIWEGELTFPWQFFTKLHRMYLQCPDWDNGEYMVWRPFDRNQKTYPVELINILVDGEEFNLSWMGRPYGAGPASKICSTGGDAGRDVLSAGTLELWLRLRPEVAPGVAVFLREGSTTAEAGFFDPE